MSERGQATVYKLTSVVIAGILAALIVNLLDYYGPRIEGRIFPVAQSHQNNIERLSEPNKIKVGGIMSKYRNCDLISTTAFISDAAGNRVVARVDPAATVKLRPVEANVEWGPWRVDTPVWARKAWLTVVTVHQCHPLWVTQTEFLRAVID
jgi:hypothetical protein